LKIVSRVLCALGLVAAFASGAYAEQNLIAEVPFSFQLNKQVMPAGTYTIREALQDNQRVMAIHGPSKSAVVLTNNPDYAASAPKLVFQRLGDEFVLIRIVGSHQQNDLPLTGSQKRELSQASAVTEVTMGIGR